MTAAPTEREVWIMHLSRQWKDGLLRTFWNEIALIEVVFGWRVWNTSIDMLVQGAADGSEKVTPIGVTICHRSNSLLIASIYGRRGLSSYVGSLSLEMTESSSACARFCTSGKRTRAKKSAVIKETVWKTCISQEVNQRG